MERVKLNLTSSLDERAHDFLEKKRDIDRHCENMKKPGALMGEPELQAVADIRGASVKVRGLLLPLVLDHAYVVASIPRCEP